MVAEPLPLLHNHSQYTVYSEYIQFGLLQFLGPDALGPGTPWE